MSDPLEAEDARRAAGKVLIAHRGASAYAPEHTLPAYRLAIEQGADFIEPDLQITRDGVLIALHDLTLERTTDVEQLFPQRHREERLDSEVRRVWYASDFTLEEIRSLDAGSWFATEHAGARIPTLEEVILLALDHGVGIFPETKAPEVYGARGFDMERLLVDELARHDLEEAGAHPRTPVVVQSFSEASLRVLMELGSDLPRVFLISSLEDLLESDAEGVDPRDPGSTLPDAQALERIASFAVGLGPAKSVVLSSPDVVALAHEAGLTVTPWTFRSARTGGFPDVTSEMRHFLYELGVDGLFTDNPDLFPRSP